jgi:hypothetical protein
MNIRPRREMATYWQREIGDSLFKFEHFVIQGHDSATYVYRRVFDYWNPDGYWSLEKVIRFYA